MSDRLWALRFPKDATGASRYVSSDDWVIATSPLPGLIHLLGPANNTDKIDDEYQGPRRRLEAVCEIGDWQTLGRWFNDPNGSTYLSTIPSRTP